MPEPPPTPPVVAAFDVDGTLTTEDCVVPFLRLAAGRRLPLARLRRPLALAAGLARRDRDRLKELACAALAGTDAGIDITPAGVSLAQELELFVSAGLTPYEALATATADAARFLGLNDRLGSIAVGMRADLVLLPGDPLADIRAVASPLAVLQRGKRIF